MEHVIKEIIGDLPVVTITSCLQNSGTLGSTDTMKLMSFFLIITQTFIGIHLYNYLNGEYQLKVG